MYRRLFVSVMSLKLRQPRKIGRALQSRSFSGSLPITRTFILKPGDMFFFAGSLLLAVVLRGLNRFIME
jgi:energy-coupling factor transporter transmembrane protein EcfT